MKLWKENRVDQGVEIANDALAEGFMLSRWSRQPEGWPLRRRLLVYIAAPETEGGLNCVFDDPQGRELEDIEGRILHAFKSGMNRSQLERRLS